MLARARPSTNTSNSPLTRMTTAMMTNTMTMIGRESRTLVSVEGFRTGWRKGSSVCHSHCLRPFPFVAQSKFKPQENIPRRTETFDGARRVHTCEASFLHDLAIFLLALSSLPTPVTYKYGPNIRLTPLLPHRREDQNCTRRVHPQLPKPSRCTQRLLAP
jgi:hypothetical protein